jgi:hypothetical protein
MRWRRGRAEKEVQEPLDQSINQRKRIIAIHEGRAVFDSVLPSDIIVSEEMGGRSLFMK